MRPAREGSAECARSGVPGWRRTGGETRRGGVRRDAPAGQAGLIGSLAWGGASRGCRTGPRRSRRPRAPNLGPANMAYPMTPANPMYTGAASIQSLASSVPYRRQGGELPDRDPGKRWWSEHERKEPARGAGVLPADGLDQLRRARQGPPPLARTVDAGSSTGLCMFGLRGIPALIPMERVTRLAVAVDDHWYLGRRCSASTATRG